MNEDGAVLAIEPSLLHSGGVSFCSAGAVFVFRREEYARRTGVVKTSCRQPSYIGVQQS